MSRPLIAVLGGAVAALVAAQPLVAAEYYKWVDEAGVTHYSQQPPPDDVRARVKAESATLPASTPDAPPGGSASAGEPGTQSGAEDAEADEGPGTVAEFCKQMREREQTLAGDRPVRTKNADGTLEPLAGEARQQRLQQVRSQIEQHCQGDGEGRTAEAE